MLKYVGNGWMHNVPARDLSDEEVIRYGGLKFLLSTGIYQEVKSMQEKNEVNHGYQGTKKNTVRG